MDKDTLIKECIEKMEKTIEATKFKFASIRAGRANVSMLDGIKVSQYGSDMALNQVGTVSAPEARLLVIDPWDKSIIPSIEKAIMGANLGLTPNNDGRVIRLVIPELTAERRKEYVKIAKKDTEEGKVAVRNIRKEINNGLRRLEKEEELTSDELKLAEAEVQKITDEMTKEIERLLSLKEKEITTV